MNRRNFLATLTSLPFLAKLGFAAKKQDPIEIIPKLNCEELRSLNYEDTTFYTSTGIQYKVATKELDHDNHYYDFIISIVYSKKERLDLDSFHILAVDCTKGPNSSHHLITARPENSVLVVTHFPSLAKLKDLPKRGIRLLGEVNPSIKLLMELGLADRIKHAIKELYKDARTI